MAEARLRKLKVFQAQIGFYDTVVAAPSRAAALRAWGASQNMFEDGWARTAEDPQAVEAARADPGVVLKRAVGTADAFAREAASLPSVPPSRRTNAPKEAAKRPSPPRAKPPADRGTLDAAEKNLAKLEERRALEKANLRRREQDLETAKQASQAVYVAEREAAEQAVANAMRAYRKAGGED